MGRRSLGGDAFGRHGLDPRIHRKKALHLKRMDCRVKPGNDGVEDKSGAPIVPRARSAPSPACGGGVGRGWARTICLLHAPPLVPPRPPGGGYTAHAAAPFAL